MSTQPDIIKAEGHENWFKLSREIQAIKPACKFTLLESMILESVINFSYCAAVPSRTSGLTPRRLTKVLPGMDDSGIRKARIRLVERRIILETDDGLAVNTNLTEWRDVDQAIWAAQSPHAARFRRNPIAGQPSGGRASQTHLDDEPHRTAVPPIPDSRPAYTGQPSGGDAGLERRGERTTTGPTTTRDHRPVLAADAAPHPPTPAPGAAGRGSDATSSRLSGGLEDARGREIPGRTPVPRHPSPDSLDSDPHRWLIHALIGHATRTGIPESAAKPMLTAISDAVKRGTALGIDGKLSGDGPGNGFLCPETLCAAINIQCRRWESGGFAKIRPENLINTLVGASLSAYREPSDGSDGGCGDGAGRGGGWIDPEPGALARLMRIKNPDKHWRGMTCSQFQARIDQDRIKRELKRDADLASAARTELEQRERMAELELKRRDKERAEREQEAREQSMRDQRERQLAFSAQKDWLSGQRLGVADVAAWLRSFPASSVVMKIHETTASLLDEFIATGEGLDWHKLDLVTKAVKDFRRAHERQREAARGASETAA